MLAAHAGRSRPDSAPYRSVMRRLTAVLPAILILLVLSCTADAPAPSLLILDAGSESHARSLASSLTTTPVLAPETSRFKGLFEVAKADVSTFALTAQAPGDLAPLEDPARLARMFARHLEAVVAREASGRHRAGNSETCLEASRRHAFRLYFIESAADEHRGHAPSGAAAEHITVDGATVRLSLVDETDPTLPATPAEIRRRLTHTAFTPCSLGETGPYRRLSGDGGSEPGTGQPPGQAPAAEPADRAEPGAAAPAPGDGGNNPGDGQSRSRAPGSLPDLVEIRLEGEPYARLARADRYERTSAGDFDMFDELEPASAASSGRLYAAGTRYDLLVANTDSARLQEPSARRRLLEAARRAAFGLPVESTQAPAGINEPVRLLEPPAATGTPVAADTISSALESIGVEVTSPVAAEETGDSEGNGRGDPGEMYRQALFSGDYELARIVWESESASDTEILRMFRSVDPRNYAELADDHFDALVEQAAAPDPGASDPRGAENPGSARTPGAAPSPGAAGIPGSTPPGPGAANKSGAADKSGAAPTAPGPAHPPGAHNPHRTSAETAWRYLEEQGAVTRLSRNLHAVDWKLYTDGADEAAGEIRRTVVSRLRLDAYGQLWFAR